MAENDEKPVDDESTAPVDDESQDENAEEEETTEPQTDDEGEANEDESSEEESDEDAGDDTDSEDDEDEKPEFEKRFPRFKGDTPQEYIKNLEDGYQASAEEAIRLNRELTALQNMQSDRDGSDDDATPPAPKDPNLQWAEQERQKQWSQDWQNFASRHPELETDQTLFAEFDKKTGDMFAFIQQTEKRMPTLEEAMSKTWNYMFPDNPDAPSKPNSKEETIAMATKNAGAGTKRKGVTKDPPKPKYSDKAIETAKRFDPTLRNKSRAEIEEILDKYSKS